MSRRTHVLLNALGGAAALLLVAGTAQATDPSPQAAGSAMGASKIGIDPVTGKRRALTSAESAALDAQAAKAARKGAAAKIQFPTSTAESQAITRTINGITIEKPSADTLSSLTVTRNADGTLSFQENGESIPQPKAKEMASE